MYVYTHACLNTQVYCMCVSVYVNIDVNIRVNPSVFQPIISIVVKSKNESQRCNGAFLLQLASVLRHEHLGRAAGARSRQKSG